MQMAKNCFDKNSDKETFWTLPLVSSTCCVRSKLTLVLKNQKFDIFGLNNLDPLVVNTV